MKKHYLNDSKFDKKVFADIDDFYSLPDEDAVKLIGQIIYEVKVIKKGRQKHQLVKEFLPIGLSNKNENYGKSVGLLYISEIFTNENYIKWFRIGAFSPDDLDLDLDFENEECKLRNKIIEFLLSLLLEQTSYKEVLNLIFNEFKAGKIHY